MKKTAFVSIVCVALLALAVPAHAASGDPDTSFDSDGIFTFGLGNPAEEGATAAVVDPSTGDLIVGNYIYPSDMPVTKVLPGGGVDAAFGGGTAALGPAHTRLTNAVGVQPDGKVLAAGNGGTNGQDVFLVRYRANGNPDDSFGNNGLAKVTVCGDSAYETNVFVRPDGSIVIVGDCGKTPIHNKLFVLVFRPGGGLDGSFSGDGMLQLAIGDNFHLTDAVLGDHDRLTVVGYSYVGSGDQRATVLRLTRSGKLDATFSGDGRAFFDFVPADDDPHAVIARGTGVLVAEQAFVSGADSDILVFAVTSAGKLDTSFSSDGEASVNLATSTSEFPSDAVSDASGRIYLSATYTYVNAEATVLRLKRNGALDLTFAGSGYAHTGLASSGGAVTMWKAKPTITGYANFSTDIDDLVARFLA